MSINEKIAEERERIYHSIDKITLEFSKNQHGDIEFFTVFPKSLEDRTNELNSFALGIPQLAIKISRGGYILFDKIQDYGVVHISGETYRKIVYRISDKKL